VLFPRTFLYRWLARCKSSALPPDVCSFAESRFGAGFGDVRIRTGQAADGLCTVLGARACTLGCDIVFADRAWAPLSERGLRLLAHGLAQVLQQRAGFHLMPARASARLVPVGDPDDACEQEAGRLAGEALDGGVCSPVTPDTSGALRLC
jgi:hypothetical protein